MALSSIPSLSCGRRPTRSTSFRRVSAGAPNSVFAFQNKGWSLPQISSLDAVKFARRMFFFTFGYNPGMRTLALLIFRRSSRYLKQS